MPRRAEGDDAVLRRRPQAARRGPHEPRPSHERCLAARKLDDRTFATLGLTWHARPVHAVGLLAAIAVALAGCGAEASGDGTPPTTVTPMACRAAQTFTYAEVAVSTPTSSASTSTRRRRPTASAPTGHWSCGSTVGAGPAATSPSSWTTRSRCSTAPARVRQRQLPPDRRNPRPSLAPVPGAQRRHRCLPRLAGRARCPDRSRSGAQIAVLGHSAGGGITAAISADERYLGRLSLPLDTIRCAGSMDGEGYDVTAGATTSPPEWQPTYTTAFGTEPGGRADASLRSTTSPLARGSRPSSSPPEASTGTSNSASRSSRPSIRPACR